VKAPIALHGEMGLQFVKDAKKQGKILILTMCFSSHSFETLEAKENSNSN
jgi:hypothetical protein